MQALVKLLQLVRTDLERERKSRNGLKGMSQSVSPQENQNIADKLYHVRDLPKLTNTFDIRIKNNKQFRLDSFHVNVFGGCTI